MNQPIEAAVELTAQELLSPPSPQGFVEIDDIATVVMPQIDAAAANVQPPPADCSSDSIEIELTPEEIDMLLGTIL